MLQLPLDGKASSSVNVAESDEDFFMQLRIKQMSAPQ